MSASSAVDGAPPANVSGALVCPPWLFLLDDPQPQRVVIAGEPDEAVIAWFASVGVTVEVQARPTTVRPSAPVDLLVITSSVRLGRHVDCLELLDRSLGSTMPGAAVITSEVTRASAAPILARHQLQRLRSLGPGQGNARRCTGLVALTGTDGEEVSELATPPRWLLEVAGSARWSPGPGEWSLRVPDAYPSQKAVIRCHPHGPDAQDAIVKLTRHQRFNGRLDNEAARLRGIGASAPGAARRAPKVLADGRCGDVAFVVETSVAGRPFPQASRFDARCPMAADAVAAIGDLAGDRGRTVAGRPLAERLDSLLARYVNRFRPDADVSQFLGRQIRAIGDAQLPAVVFHGDLGAWNLLVDEGRVRILDWESCEDPGPPIWDLAYFSRSFAVRAGRRRGLRRDRAIGRHLLGSSALNTTIAAWFHDHVERIGLDPCLVEPLFHTTWLHRAVKESDRLAPGTDGHYGPLCARLVAEREAPGLRRILGR